MALTKCCICIKQDSVLIPVSEECEDNVTTLQKLQLVSPFQDWLSRYFICSICADLLEISYQFVVLCNKHELERLGQRETESNVTKAVLPKQEMEIITIKIEHKIDNDFEPNESCNDSSENKCLKCNKTFSTIFQLGTHMMIDHDYKCKICCIDFRTKASLRRHLKLEHSKTITCEICGEDFLKLQTLIRHCAVKHSLKTSEVKPYRCDKCDKRFSSWSSMKRHLQYHEGARNYTCKMCGKCFITKKDVDMHELIHKNEKKYCCETCNKRFNTLSNLRTHIKCVHTDPNERKYECYLCSRKFSLKATLEEHVKRHMGLKEHLCMICGRSFISKHELKCHTYCHTKDRPYKCDFCDNKSYRDRKGLKQHVEKYHSGFTL